MHIEEHAMARVKSSEFSQTEYTHKPYLEDCHGARRLPNTPQSLLSTRAIFPDC